MVVANQLSVKHQGKDIHHPPSTIYKWPLTDLPRSTLCPSLSLSFTISSLYLTDLIEVWNVYVEASLINKMHRMKLIRTAFYSLTGGGRIWMIGFRWQKHWSTGKFQSIINQLANCCNANLTYFHSVICSHKLQRQAFQDMRKLWCLFQLKGWLPSPKY